MSVPNPRRGRQLHRRRYSEKQFWTVAFCAFASRSYFSPEEAAHNADMALEQFLERFPEPPYQDDDDQDAIAEVRPS